MHNIAWNDKNFEHKTLGDEYLVFEVSTALNSFFKKTPFLCIVKFFWDTARMGGRDAYLLAQYLKKWRKLIHKSAIF